MWTVNLRVYSSIYTYYIPCNEWEKDSLIILVAMIRSKYTNSTFTIMNNNGIYCNDKGQILAFQENKDLK